MSISFFLSPELLRSANVNWQQRLSVRHLSPLNWLNSSVQSRRRNFGGSVNSMKTEIETDTAHGAMLLLCHRMVPLSLIWSWRALGATSSSEASHLIVLRYSIPKKVCFLPRQTVLLNQYSIILPRISWHDLPS